jgi:hypothetical protein
MNTIRVDTSNVKRTPCGMNSIRYIGDNMESARRAFNHSAIGYDAWGKPNADYGIILSKWSPSKNDYVVIDSKGL